ncbi:hypothetical protein Cgig2_030561 [Carnegiea gigantea]|uniref:Dirigent protein n=1 Tax=Carnegiea gigantea TaxID=171969 RepID=A0A9Q1GPA9_9CARY|nr:hypothetical protein Cgig2_030561 [Carnegiea gigantea]
MLRKVTLELSEAKVKEWSIRLLSKLPSTSNHKHLKMAKSLPPSTLCLLLLLALALGLVSSARILDGVDPQATVTEPSTQDDLPALPPTVGPVTDLPSGQAPVASVAPADDTPTPDDQPDQTQPNPEATTAPVVAPIASRASPLPTGPAQGGAVASATAVAPGSGGPEHPAISFFMHDVLGGSQASGRIVTGIVATTDVNGIPFSKPNDQVFPVTNGVPLINNNNVPFLASLNGQNQQQSQTVIQNAGTNNIVNGGNNNQAFVTPGQLPTGVTLQKLMFGSITVIDDELTEGHELGSGVMGRGQGFYLASSLDGESHTMAFTAILHQDGHDEADTISFFGVHRTASPISQIAVIGGTGKYETAKGYATIETLPQQDQHTTDGVDTIAHINVYLY